MPESNTQHLALTFRIVLSVVLVKPAEYFMRSDECKRQKRAVMLAGNKLLCLFLQNVVSRSALQFKGNSQHDAQEFLLWLLDRVHEDLNNIVHPEIRPPRKVGSVLE